MQELEQQRLQANKELLKLLEEIITANPYLRFSQILQSYDFVSYNKDFYAEPNVILTRVKEKIKEYEVQRASSNT